MIIEEKDFKLELNPINTKFDLYLLQVVNAKNEEKRREEFQLEGYGMSLETCFRYIINYRIDKKHDILSLREYVLAYKKEKEDIANILSTQLNA
jgi:hypothetical protein